VFSRTEPQKEGECGVSNGSSPIHVHTSKLILSSDSDKNGRLDEDDRPYGVGAPRSV